MQEEYLSECHYEERVDEEGIRNILSLGEDYRWDRQDYRQDREDYRQDRKDYRWDREDYRWDR